MDTIAPIATPRRQTWFFAGLAAFGVVLLALGAAARDPQEIVYGATTLALGLFGIILMRLSRRNSRLLVGSGQFGYQDAFGRQHIWFAAQVATVLDMSVVYNKGARPRRAIYVLGLDGKRLVIVDTAPYTDSAIDRFTSATGKPVEVIREPLPVRDFKRRFPNAVGWMGGHSMLGGAMIGVGLLFIGLLAVFVVATLMRR